MDPFDLRLWPGFLKAGGDSSLPAITDQIAIDSRRVDSPQALFVALEGQNSDGHEFIPQAVRAGAQYILVQKAWELPASLPKSIKILRVDSTLHALQSIAKAYRKQLPGTFVAITGSYGKTMVKDLLLALVSSTKRTAASPESFNSQIGVALSLLTVNKSHEVAFIETGFSEKNEMDRLIDMIAPDHAIMTPVGKKHMTTLGGIEAIVEEMSKLLIAIPEGNWVLLPKSPLISPFLAKMQAKPNEWNVEVEMLPHATTLEGLSSSLMPYQVTFPDGAVYEGHATMGFYYFQDLINIVVKTAWLLGVPSDAISEVLSRYNAEPMRTEIWKSPTGITFINDTYCSDPQSVDRSLRYLDQTGTEGRKAFVFGGMRDKKQHVETDYRHIGQMIKRARINKVILVGDHPFHFLVDEISHEDATPISITLCKDHQEAIEKLKDWAHKEDSVLIKGDKKEPLDIITEAFNDSLCTNQCWINFAAIEANINTLRSKLASGTRIMVMVKALAYGTNDFRIGRFLATCGVDILGVSYVDEGVALKRLGISQTIFVLNAAVYEANKIAKWGLEVGVSEKGMIESLAEAAVAYNKKIKVHLHIDTGMSRFGCRSEEAFELAQYILQFPSLELEGLMTHFACSDDPLQDDFTLSQASALDGFAKRLRDVGIEVPWVHAANSGGVMRFNFPEFNMVRIGLAAYGLYPSEAAKELVDLRLALTLSSRIVGINTCRVGETISYGRTYTVTRDHQRIAVLPIGYFDGLHRNYSGKGSVIIRGKKAPMVGKICMDFMMVDISDIPNAAIGDPVLIFGEDEYGQYLSPEELASSGDSIIYELITCLGPRIQRIFIYEEAHHLR